MAADNKAKALETAISQIENNSERAPSCALGKMSI